MGCDLHLGEGRTTEAWQDIVTMNRLATLSGRRGSLTEGRLSIAFVNIVSGPTLTFLAHAKLDARMARDCLRDLSELPPLTDLSDHMDLTERVTFLDAAQRNQPPGRRVSG